MQLQYVFGNPIGPKKSKKGSKKVAKKKMRRKKNPKKVTVKTYEVVPMKNMKTGKITKKRGKSAGKRTVTVMTQAEIKRAKAKILEARALIDDLKLNHRIAKGKTAKSLYKRLIKSSTDKMVALDKAVQSKVGETKNLLKALDMEIKAARKAGLRVTKTISKVSKKTRKKGKKKVAKKKASKKKASKKKTSKKKVSRKKKASKKKVSKKKASKKKASKKKVSRKKKASKKKASKKKAARKKTSKKKASKKRSKTRRTTLKSGSTLVVKANPKRKKRRGRRKKNPYFGGVIMKKSNPVSVGGMQISGYDVEELLSLAGGGFAYQAVNQYAAPFIAKVPVIGPAIAGFAGGTGTNLALGIGLNILAGSKAGQSLPKIGQNKVNLAELAGDALLGAALVGFGVHFAQSMLGGGMAGLGNVDYIPVAPGVDPDFNGIPSGLQGVDFTPDGGYMSGVDFTAGMSLPGQNPEVDFGKWNYEQDTADFGGVPEGLS